MLEIVLRTGRCAVCGRSPAAACRPMSRALAGLASCNSQHVLGGCSCTPCPAPPVCSGPGPGPMKRLDVSGVQAPQLLFLEPGSDMVFSHINVSGGQLALGRTIKPTAVHPRDCLPACMVPCTILCYTQLSLAPSRLGSQAGLTPVSAMPACQHTRMRCPPGPPLAARLGPRCGEMYTHYTSHDHLVLCHSEAGECAPCAPGLLSGP